jgi:hypothetical protein
MDNRKAAWLRAVMLTLLPVAMIFPVITAAHFEPAGPARVWPVMAFAPLAIRVETQAIVASRHVPKPPRSVLDRGRAAWLGIGAGL